MNKEKLLYFLDISDTESLNKSAMKVFLWFDVSFSAIIICFGLLFKCISDTWFDRASVCVIFATMIAFIIFYKFVKNVIANICYTALIPCVSMLKLFYGYWIFSNAENKDFEYPLFTWVHLTCLIVALSIFILFVYFQIKLYRDINKMTLQELIDREKKTKIDANKFKSHPCMFLFLVLFSSPYIASKFIKELDISKGLGIGFGMWLLACCWIVFISLYFPKFVVCIKNRLLLKDIKQ